MKNMCKVFIVFLGFLISLHFYSAKQQHHQQHGGQWEKNQCQFESLMAQEPHLTLKSEGGVTEFWDWNHQQFQCAGAAVLRSFIRPRGLLLPKYSNAPQHQFMLAGNPYQGQQRPGASTQPPLRENIGNVFRGFDTKLLANIFGVDQETARKLQGQDDQRGRIILVEGGLQVIRPPIHQEEQQGGHGSQWTTANGLEETICSTRLVHNINDPSRADFFNPHAGRRTSLNRFHLPILKYLQLSVERGILYRDAIEAPHWDQNAHTIIYATKGGCQMQVVDQSGQAVMNDRIREGQLVIVPQNFAVAKQASSQGFEWIAVKTSENGMFDTVAVSTSAIRAMPIDVLANAYPISREQASNLKFNREPVIVFEPGQRSQRNVA